MATRCFMLGSSFCDREQSAAKPPNDPLTSPAGIATSATRVGHREPNHAAGSVAAPGSARPRTCLLGLDEILEIEPVVDAAAVLALALGLGEGEPRFLGIFCGD